MGRFAARQYRKGLPEVPTSLRSLPIDWRGYPVPYFVAWIKGFPDHRIVEPDKFLRCVRHSLCWVCGKPLTFPAVFVSGPMCGVNRVSSEPPSHEDCARFAVKACPFLSKPHMVRREAGLPELPEGDVLQDAPGTMLKHNPGVSLLWWATRSKVFKAGDNPRSHNYLFEIGEPLKVEWWAEGRPATRAECEAGIEKGLPKFFELCETAADTLYITARADELRRLLPEA